MTFSEFKNLVNSVESADPMPGMDFTKMITMLHNVVLVPCDIVIGEAEDEEA
jgi:hypothetical protein